MIGAGTARRVAGSLALVLASGPLHAQPQIPERRPLVMDAANVISAEKETLLSDALAGFRQTQQREVSVVTVADLQGYAIDDYMHELRAASGLDGLNDDGAVLLVAPNDMNVRIEVGSAVKSVLPDDVARGIVETRILPSFAQGDIDKGVLDGAGAILTYLELSPEQAAALAAQTRLDEAQAREPEGFPWAGLAVLVLIFLFWGILRKAGGLLGLAAGAVSLIGRGSGGFGGFAGGGRGFNGGGASGRW